MTLLTTALFTSCTLRRTALLMSAASWVVLAAAPAAAQTFPSKPIEWVVPYPAGGGTDVVARVLAEHMGRQLGQGIVINNRPGAATNIGAEYTARAKADGYVVMTGDTATLAANPALYSKLSYNVEKDLAPVGLIGRFNLFLVVNNTVPAKNMKEFLAWVKAQNNPVNYGSPGAGSPHHLAAELFAQRAGIKLTHVPYRGAAPAVQDLIGNQIPFMLLDSATAFPYISSGKIRALGVAAPKRTTSFPEVPTFHEQGLTQFEAYAWQGMLVPAGTPEAVAATLNTALRQALNATEVKARFQVLGVEPTPGTPKEMADYAHAERTKWSSVIRAANIRLD
jgi:tripartite-type tricarboxylate transporter receptor subunit TctC